MTDDLDPSRDAADDASAEEERPQPDEATLATIRELQARLAEAEARPTRGNGAVDRLRDSLAATPRSVKLLLVGVGVFGTLTLSGLRCGSESDSKAAPPPSAVVRPG